MKPVLAAVGVSLALVAGYAAAGGAAYGPSEVGDPCDPRAWSDPETLDELAQQLALSGMDGAACELGVTRESLARALASEQARRDFMAEHGIDAAELEAAVRAGLLRMIDDAVEAGEIGPVVAFPLRAVVRAVPSERAFDLLLDARPLLEDDFGLDGDEGGSGGDGDGLGELDPRELDPTGLLERFVPSR